MQTPRGIQCEPPGVSDAFVRQNSPAAKAVKAVVDDPSPAAFATLLQNLPALLPQDPALAAVIADEMARTYGAVFERDEADARHLANEFREEDHPRDADGKFTDGTGSVTPQRQALQDFERTLSKEELAEFEAGRDRRLDYNPKFQKWEDLRDAAVRSELPPSSEDDDRKAWAARAEQLGRPKPSKEKSADRHEQKRVRDIDLGRAAVERSMENKSDAYNAMRREGVGTITFPYAELSRMGASARDALPEVIVRGKAGKPYSGGRMVDISHGGNSATLSKVSGSVWALAGFQSLANEVANPCPRCHRNMPKDGVCSFCSKRAQRMKKIGGLVDELGKKSPDGKHPAWSHKEETLGEVDGKTAAAIRAAMPGIDAEGQTFEVDTTQMQHALNHHGLGREKNPAQIPITSDDLRRIPDVLFDYDEIVPGKGIRDGKKDNAVVFKKKFDDGTLACVEIDQYSKRRGGRVLRFKTMWKEKIS